MPSLECLATLFPRCHMNSKREDNLIKLDGFGILWSLYLSDLVKLCYNKVIQFQQSPTPILLYTISMAIFSDGISLFMCR